MSNPQNEINSVGFPEGQLLANGASAEESAEISAAFLQGQPMPETGKPDVDKTIELLNDHPAYGQYKGFGENNARAQWEKYLSKSTSKAMD